MFGVKGSSKSSQRGFSLIELILALGLGLIVTAGVVRLMELDDEGYFIIRP